MDDEPDLIARLDRIEEQLRTLLARVGEASRDWFTVKQAATITGLSASYLRRAISRRELVASRLGTERHPIWRIARKDLIDWMETKKGEAAVAVPPRGEMGDLIERHLPGLRGRRA